MGRAPRVDVGGEVYHIINRANGRQTIFHTKEEYLHFEQLLTEAKELNSMRILAYILMSNHWHLVLHPHRDGDLSVFMQWLTLTHTQQYHSRTKTIGYGHLYQGRYKSFLVEKDNHLLQLIRYVERNAFRAKLVKQAENWRWGSAYRRTQGAPQAKALLSDTIIELPKDYLEWLNEKEDAGALAIIRQSVNKGTPLGAVKWVKRTVDKFDLLLTTRLRGRPKDEKGT
ncbi:MAG: transposase [Candidatus Taylorbacteria bacterium]|nr:transposase [Candidatus Taylorbacteria bacterium]